MGPPPVPSARSYGSVFGERKLITPLMPWTGFIHSHYLCLNEIQSFFPRWSHREAEEYQTIVSKLFVAWQGLEDVIQIAHKLQSRELESHLVFLVFLTIPCNYQEIITGPSRLSSWTIATVRGQQIWLYLALDAWIKNWGVFLYLLQAVLSIPTLSTLDIIHPQPRSPWEVAIPDRLAYFNVYLMEKALALWIVDARNEGVS